MWTLARIIATPIYKLLFRFRITGRENIPKEGGVILCANHISNHDPLVVGISSPRNLNFLAKEEMYKYKIFRPLMRGLKVIPVNRAKPSMDTLKQVIKTLKEGEAVGIFMQGRRRRKSLSEPEMGDYKAGVALFAIKSEVPVVPIYLQSRYLPFSKVIVNIGEPISLEEYYAKRVKTDELNEAAAKIMTAIEELGRANEDNHG